MATTRYAQSVAGPLPKTVKFSVTADNDVLLSGGNFLVLGAYFEGLATALNIDAGADIAANVGGISVADDETLNVTASGAGAVTLVFVALPVAGYSTFDV